MNKAQFDKQFEQQMDFLTQLSIATNEAYSKEDPSRYRALNARLNEQRALFQAWIAANEPPKASVVIPGRNQNIVIEVTDDEAVQKLIRFWNLIPGHTQLEQLFLKYVVVTRGA